MPHFATKADWADAKARECDDAAAKLDDKFVHYTKLGRKNESIAHWRSEAMKFRSMAATFRRQGK